MEAFGTLTRLEATAAAACVTYIERTQVGKRPPLSPPAREAAGTTMAIDPATRANLELTRTLSGERRGSLLAALDCTVTAAGSRLLAQRLAAPLTDAAVIARRLDAVSVFADDVWRARRTAAGRCMPRPDMARALARLSVGRGGPRDLAALCAGIAAADEVLARLGAMAASAAGDRQRRSSAAPAATRAGGGVRPRARRRAAADQARRRLRPRSATSRHSTRPARCATNRAAWSRRCRRATPTRPASRR